MATPTCCRLVEDNGVVSEETRGVQLWWDQWLGNKMEQYGFGPEQQAKIICIAAGTMIPAAVVTPLPPYPWEQYRIYEVVRVYQAKDDQVPNVTVTEVPGGCGRSPDVQCWVGHGKYFFLLKPV